MCSRVMVLKIHIVHLPVAVAGRSECDGKGDLFVMLLCSPPCDAQWDRDTGSVAKTSSAVVSLHLTDVWS